MSYIFKIIYLYYYHAHKKGGDDIMLSNDDFKRSIILSARVSPMEYGAIEALAEIYGRSRNDIIALLPLAKVVKLLQDYDQEGDTMMTIEEAKALLTPEKINKLKEMVTPKPTINTENKSNNDILMTALCTACENDIIKSTSLDDRIIKLLNSATNTLSPSKLSYIMQHVRSMQPYLVCCITIKDKDMNMVSEWNYVGPNIGFHGLFEYVVETFEITPQMIRTKMTTMLKPTIVNNIAQLVAKYQTLEEDERKKLNISITTISRLVNMCGYLIFAEFKELKA